MATEKPIQDEKAEAARQLSAWIIARCDIEELPQVVSWLEQAKSKAVIDHLMATLARHRRRNMSQAGPT